ncbi:MAG: sigma-70 family RNA polymerase sigma factor [Spirochaetes bacterium]|nr:sigma-70 family RNA polymerase sigma factor [Spirochaetota bacterium]
MSAEREHRKRVAAFITREWDRLVAAVRSWIDDEADRDAEDIVQDVMEGLFERPDVTAPIRDLSAFVWRSLRNRVVDRFRSRRAAVSLDAPGDGGDGPLGEAFADSRSDADRIAEQSVLRQRIDTAIDNLGDAERAVFLATELEGRKFRELAAEWDTPIGTLLARKHRAVTRLRAALADLEGTEGGAS